MEDLSHETIERVFQEQIKNLTLTGKCNPEN